MSSKKPIVVLLENYVLAAVGELPTEEQLRTKHLMKRAFGAQAAGDWQVKLREEFGVTEALDEQLRTIWSQAKKLAEEKESELSPREFASMIVEENFHEAIGMIAAEAEANAEASDD